MLRYCHISFIKRQACRCLAMGSHTTRCDVPQCNPTMSRLANKTDNGGHAAGIGQVTMSCGVIPSYVIEINLHNAASQAMVCVLSTTGQRSSLSHRCKPCSFCVVALEKTGKRIATSPQEERGATGGDKQSRTPRFSWIGKQQMPHGQDIRHSTICHDPRKD